MDLLKGDEEDCIRHYKSMIKEEGYGYIKQESYRILYVLQKSSQLRFHHLLSIARWECQREKGKPASVSGCASCGLCLYQISLLEVSSAMCMRGDGCVLHESGDCCKEYFAHRKDNALSLIQRLRKEYINKYYKEDKPMVEKFWMIKKDHDDYGNKKKYNSEDDAIIEANKLCKINGDRYFVLKAIGYVEEIETPTNYVEM